MGNSRIANTQVRTNCVSSKKLDYLIAQFIALFSINLILLSIRRGMAKIIPSHAIFYWDDVLIINYGYL